MSPLQFLLVAAGIVLVIAVVVYNRWVEARWRRGSGGTASHRDSPPELRGTERIEPTLAAEQAAEVVEGSGSAASPAAETAPAGRPASAIAAPAAPMDAGPDREIECIVTLEPVEPVAAGALAAGLHARVGKRLRWFGRTRGADAWEPLTSDSRGRYSEVIACMLLADRHGAASAAQLDAFVHLVGELTPHLPAAFVPPDLAREAQRAEVLDQLCADLDVQIGLTVQKHESETIQGTRLRGVAEASGFHLAPGGRFEFVHEDTGAVLYTLQDVRGEPFTADSLRLGTTAGAVLVLDVARVADPPRVFDQMKLCAKRLAATLGASLVDDNRRPLDDAAFAKVREQVVVATDALTAVNIEPGSARARALFGA